ncbi:hypothetical protein CALCODRAFT_494549 [Calocera cornea HHB12733]|uniref:Uncharacterized protein n=1 Tax=Calocera cornea HHB12733 TaxID=1353952 RepID=A0A165GYN1_9BASI|nr:hypothetical protein CALCODRAFT_494549 [Calocera cornea HHB12733]
MQFFGLLDGHFAPPVGVIQVPSPLPLPIAVTPRSAHPLPQLAVHRSSKPLSPSANIILQIYEPSQPRSGFRRASRSSPPSTTLIERGPSVPPAPFRSTKSWPNNLAKVDIDTPTKELAELAFQLEDKLRQEIPVDTSLQLSACRPRGARSGNSALADETTPTTSLDHPRSLLANDTTNTPGFPESANREHSSAQGHQSTFKLLDAPIGRQFDAGDVPDVLAAGDVPALQLNHATSISLDTHDDTLTGDVWVSPVLDAEDQQPLALVDTSLSISEDLAYISAWVETTAPRRSRNSLDNEARFSMVMEVLSSEPVHIRRRAFDEDLWSFTSAGTTLHDPAAIGEITRQAYANTEPRREWVFRNLHDRAFYRPRRRRGPPRDVTPLGRRELRKEAIPETAPSNEEDETERDTEEEAAKEIDRAEEAAKELAEAAVAETEQPSSTSELQAEQAREIAPEPSARASTDSSHTKRPSVSEATERPATPSSDESDESVPPEYRPDWIPFARDRLGFEWWFLVDEECNLHWSFSYSDDGGHQSLLPRSEYERVLRMRRRTAALQLGRLSVVNEEEG